MVVEEEDEAPLSYPAMPSAVALGREVLAIQLERC